MFPPELKTWWYHLIWAAAHGGDAYAGLLAQETGGTRSRGDWGKVTETSIARIPSKCR